MEGNDNSQNEELNNYKEDNQIPLDISSPKRNTEDKFESLEINVEKENILHKDNYFDIKQIEEPRKIGNLFALYYKNGDPLIIIGPHCNFD